MTISTGLRQAMTDSKLEMYYQPKLDLAASRVMSVEALLRWNHPQLGFISPEEIVDVAENTGLIWPLTEWTLQNAINDARAWFGMGFQVRVAVNLSARLLQDMTLIERITACLKTCAADPQWLSLEITESAIMHDPDRALKNAKTLSARGIHLSIDDFGTGYSSLSYLRKLPVNELKIDKSFVMDMLNEGNDLLIVKSTIELAHTLGLKVVAEGVESEVVLKTLQDLGCDVVQGYLISRPIPGENMSQWLSGHYREALITRASGA
jgi:EAL domain-containing protein (putative c-di-GMP-specific phosphodiesterase class I)